MPYRINVSQHGRHVFATANHSLDGTARDLAFDLVRKLRKTFTKDEGYDVTLSEWTLPSGHSIDVPDDDSVPDEITLAWMRGTRTATTLVRLDEEFETDYNNMGDKYQYAYVYGLPEGPRGYILVSRDSNGDEIFLCDVGNQSLTHHRLYVVESFLFNAWFSHQ